MASAVVLIVLAFVPHFVLANFFKRLLRVATFILVFCICAVCTLYFNDLCSVDETR